MSYRRSTARLRRKSLSVSMERLLWSSAAALALATGAAPEAARAATITVTSPGDTASPATCTLRQAVVSTNTGSTAGTGCSASGAFGEDTILFDGNLFGANTMTIPLEDMLRVEAPPARPQPPHLTIDAGAGRNVVVKGRNAPSDHFTVMRTSNWPFQEQGSLHLAGLTLQDGVSNLEAGHFLKYSPSVGGGLYAHGMAVTLDRCTVSNNAADMGGGIFVESSTLDIVDSIVSGNTALQTGGGGIGLHAASATIRNSTISGNTSLSSHGGGAIFIYLGRSFTVVDSTISGNSGPNAQGRAGGSISFTVNSPVDVSLLNDTIACNTGAPGGQVIGSVPFGPAVFEGSFASTGTLFADTASNARCPGSNQAREFSSEFGSTSAAVAGDHNLVADSTSAGTFANAPLVGDPKLGPLQDNGGSTPTHAIAADSPARNAGSNPAGLAYDQRGADYTRSVGGAPDIGAFELQQAGLCGTAHGGSFTSLGGSSPNLCSAGAALQGFFSTGPSGEGPWAWLCAPASDPLDNEFCGATVLANVTLAINGPDDQTLTHDPVYGEALHLHSYAAGPSGVAPPEGKVTFFDAAGGGFAPLCMDRVLDTGNGTWGHGWTWCVPDPDWIAGAQHLSAGQRQLKATYPGDGTYGEVLSGSYPVHVLPAASVTTIASQAPNPVTLGEPFTVVADVTLAAPSEAEAYGMIEVHDVTDDASCIYSLDAEEPGCPLTPVSAGVHELFVTFQGDGNILSSSAAGSQTVSRAATQTSLALSTASTTLGGSVTATVGVTTAVDPQVAAPGGMVAVGDGAGASCTVALPATSCTLTPVSAGARTLTAAYAGDGNFAGSSGGASLAVEAAPTTTTVSLSAATIAFGDAVTVTASIASNVPPAIAVPGGTITVDDGGSGAGDACTIVLPATNCVLNPSTAGPKTVTVTYPGDGNFAGSGSSAALIVLEPPSQLALTIDDGRDHARYGETLSYTIVLANSGNGPATDVGVNGVPGVAFGGATLAWTCTASGGATCTTIGNGTTLADTVTLPPDSSLTWVVDVTVPQDADGGTAVFSVGALDANASDSDVLVLFRDGFEP